MDGNIEIDTTLYAIQNELSLDELKESLAEDIKVYQELYDNPSSFLNMDKDDLSIIKHILFNFVKKKSLKDSKAKIWRKLNLRDNFLYNPN